MTQPRFGSSGVTGRRMTVDDETREIFGKSKDRSIAHETARGVVGGAAVGGAARGLGAAAGAAGVLRNFDGLTRKKKALMASQDFTLRTFEEYHDPAREVARLERSSHFRLPIGVVRSPQFYSRTWDQEFDTSTVLWDPDRRIAHANRIRG